MKKSLILFISIMISGSFLNGCQSVNCIKGSGELTTEKRSVLGFTKIETDAPVKIYLTQGSEQKVEIVTSDNIQSSITSVVNSGILKIGLDQQLCGSGSIAVYVTTEVYDGLKISGAAQVMGENMIDAKDFALDVSGSASVDMAIRADHINIVSCCSVDITLKGDAEELSINASGSGTLNMLNLPVGECTIQASGSTSLNVNVLKALSINASGSSEITYKGNPELSNNQLSGSSVVTKTSIQ